MSIYNEQLQQLQQQINRKEEIETQLEKLYQKQRELDAEAAELNRRRMRWQTDLERLQKRSVRNFFYKIVGKRDKMLTEERDAVNAVTEKYNRAAQELAEVEDEMKKRKIDLWEVSECQTKYDRIYKEKLDAVLVSDIPEAAEILKIEGQITEVEVREKELKEALSAGSKACSTAEAILSELKTAKGWGTYDALGGGLVATGVKHSHLDKAQEHVKHLQLQLRSLKSELADVTVDADIQVDIEGFLRFADYGFDGLLVDLAVLDKVNKSMEQVQMVQNRIGAVLNKLDAMLRAAEREKDSLRMNIETLVLQADV